MAAVRVRKNNRCGRPAYSSQKARAHIRAQRLSTELLAHHIERKLAKSATQPKPMTKAEFRRRMMADLGLADA